MTLTRTVRAAAAAAAVMALTTACVGTTGGSGDDSQVISYNTPREWANWDDVLAAFTDETGISAPSDPKNSGQALAAIEAEASAPVADVTYLGIVFGLEAEDKDLLAPLPQGVTDGIDPDLVSPDGRWTTIHQGAIAFLVNTKALGDKPVPQCWEDLTDPQYKGMVGFLEPNAAAVGYSVLSAANLGLGGTVDDWAPGMAWAKAMRAQNVSLPAQTATSSVQQGEIPILVDADFNGYQLANDADAPIEVVLPCEGTISLPYVVGIIDGAPHQAAAEEFVKFVLSEPAQQLFAKSYLRPVVDVDVDPKVSDAMLPADEYAERVQNPDFRALNDARTDVLAQWDATR